MQLSLPDTVQIGAITMLLAAFLVQSSLAGRLAYAGFGVLVAVASAAIARAVGPTDRPTRLEAAGVCFAIFGLLLLPSPRGSGAILSAGLAILVAQSAWAYLRYPDAFKSLRSAERSARNRIGRYAAWGAAYGIALTVIAAIVMGLAASSSQPRPSDLPALDTLAMAYCGGGILAGALTGLLLPLARWPLGVMLLGILGATGGYTAVGIAVDGWSLETLGIGLSIGVFVGAAFGFLVRLQWGRNCDAGV
jgi:hypothetical protein